MYGIAQSVIYTIRSTTDCCHDISTMSIKFSVLMHKVSVKLLLSWIIWQYAHLKFPMPTKVTVHGIFLHNDTCN